MSFKLEKSNEPSFFNNIVCYERVNKLVLYKLINSSLLRTDFNNPFCKKYFENEKEQLLKYKNLINQDNEAVVRYNKTEDMGDYGRVHPKGAVGLFSIRRQLRQTLSKDYYIDIDIKNCHPEILLQLCIQRGFTIKDNVKCLNKYVIKREKILLAVENCYGVNRDTSKQLFIRLMYFGKFESWLKDNGLEFNNGETLNKDDEHYKIHNFITHFTKELHNIGQIIINENKELDNLIENKKAKRDNLLSYNKKGSVCSYYLQEYENNILECIFNYMVSKNVINKDHPDCVLCADGIMIPKTNNYIKLLKEVEIEIESKFNLKLSLVEKEMKEDYINILDNSLLNDDYLKYYDVIKDKFEVNNFKVMNPIMFAEKNNSKLILRKITDFNTAYMNVNYIEEKKGDTEKKSFVKRWVLDETIKTYNRIDFQPMKIVPNDVYNSFNGYHADTIIADPNITIDIEKTKIMKHIHNLCNNDTRTIDYVINFLSRKLQKPYLLTNTALIFRSAEGCGKDSFFSWFGNMILGNDYYVCEDKIELVFGRFNELIENKILVAINETSGKDTFDMIGKIKGAITRTTNKIEKKGLSAYDNVNNIGYVFFTNNKVPLKIDPTDRRFVAIECNNSIAKNFVYFNELYEEFRDKNIAKAFFNYFMSIDCDNYDFINNRPETNFYNTLREHSTPIIIKFFEEEMHENITTNPNKIYRDLFGDYLMYLQMGNFRFEVNRVKFGIEIKEYDFIIKSRNKEGVHYTIDFIKMKEYLIQKRYINLDDLVEFID
jgi:hypothetical protein